jgi:hypothetical protein
MAEFEFITFGDLSDIMRQAAAELISEEQYELLPPL